MLGLRPTPHGVETHPVHIAALRAGKRRSSRRALASWSGFDCVRHTHRLLFHFDNDTFYAAAQVTICDERRNGDAQTCNRGYQRLRNTAGQGTRIAHAALLDGVEGADDTGDRTEQTQQWGHRRNGSQRVDVTLE